MFVDEQRVPAEIELDERDPVSIHVVASRDGEPIGTGRIDLGAGGKIGRVAVLGPYRGSGAGAALMATLHSVARTAGLRSVWCNAQVSALGFYERLGYRVAGEPFLEAGIEHRRMERSLVPAVEPEPQRG